MEDHIRVSDISNYLKCPRQVYYTYNEYRYGNSITSSYIESLLIREMARSYADVVRSVNMDDALQELLDVTVQQLTAIYREELRGIDEEMLFEAIEAVRSHLEGIKCGILESVERLGSDRLVDLLTSYDTEPVLYSKKFGLSGSPDRLLIADDVPGLSIIRTGRAPESGIWKDDRIKLTALSILVEEEYDCVVSSGTVEYARYGIVRIIKIKRADRRKVLVLAGRIRKIRNGRLPHRPDDAPCDYCRYAELCQVTPNLASRFF
jgi:CRISPR-associated exonuclease Cas4